MVFLKFVHQRSHAGKREFLYPKVETGLSFLLNHMETTWEKACNQQKADQKCEVVIWN